MSGLSPYAFMPLDNPLAFPTDRPPGFDPTHIAAKPRQVAKRPFSIVSTPNGPISLITGIPGAKVGSPVSSINSSIGPGWGSVAGNAWGFQWVDQQDNVNDSLCTFAAICCQTAHPGGTIVIVANCRVDATANPGTIALCISSAAAPYLVGWGGTTGAAVGMDVVLGTPYFMAVSNDSVNANFVQTNLLTGQIKRSTVSKVNAAAGPPTLGSFCIAASEARPFVGGIATAMFNPASMSMSELLAWAADPWSFWYPRTQQFDAQNDRSLFNPGTNAFRLRFGISNP